MNQLIKMLGSTVQVLLLEVTLKHMSLVQSQCNTPSPISVLQYCFALSSSQYLLLHGVHRALYLRVWQQPMAPGHSHDTPAISGLLDFVINPSITALLT